MITYDDLIGVPFEWWGRGPKVYDCWGVVMEMNRRMGVEIIDYGSDKSRAKIHGMMTGAILSDWKECDKKPGASILLRVKGLSCHVGYCVDNRRFIHTMQTTGGVVVEMMNAWEKRIIGYFEYVR